MAFLSLALLNDNYPGRYDNKILRTLQRRIKSWKAKYSPTKDVMFRQIKVPGRLGLSDFTGLKDATITLTQGVSEAITRRVLQSISDRCTGDAGLLEVVAVTEHDPQFYFHLD